MCGTLTPHIEVVDVNCLTVASAVPAMPQFAVSGITRLLQRICRTFPRFSLLTSLCDELHGSTRWVEK